MIMRFGRELKMEKSSGSDCYCTDYDCCDNKNMLKKGSWSPQEDEKLVDFIRSNNGHAGNWKALPKLAGILRCGKSCRLRWANYLRPDIKRGPFSQEESNIVQQLHSLIGNRWAAIAARLPGRTDNDVKNFWNTHLRRQKDITISSQENAEPSTKHITEWESIRLETEARLTMESILNPFGYPTSSSTTTFDPYLKLWHTEVGESFKKFGHGRGSKLGRFSASPKACSSTRCGSGSGITGQVEQTMGYFQYRYVKQEQHQMTSTDSEETIDCLDTAMNMLLDSPTSE